MNNNHFLALDPNIFHPSLFAAIFDLKSDPGPKYISAEPTDLFSSKSPCCKCFLLKKGQRQGTYK